MTTQPANSESVLDEIVAGEGLSLGEAARLLPAHRGSGRASPSTLWRWIINGAKALDGSNVKLEAAKFGGRHLTTRQALTRFAERLSSSPLCPYRDQCLRKRVFGSAGRLLRRDLSRRVAETWDVALPAALTITTQLMLGVFVGGIGLALATPLTLVVLVLVRTLYVRDLLGDTEGEAEYECDSTFAFIRALEQVGLTRDLKQPPEELRRQPAQFTPQAATAQPAGTAG